MDLYNLLLAKDFESGDCNKLSGLVDKSIQEVTLEDLKGVTNIGRYAFYYCYSLISVELPSSVTNIDNSAFEYCSNLKMINIPNGVTSIGTYAFRNCKKLTSISIPDSVINIGSTAFADCGLKSVDLGTGIQSMGNSSFYFCSSLRSFTIRAVTPPTLNNNIFNTSNIKIYVPEESVEDYKAAPYWSNRASSIYAIQE